MRVLLLPKDFPSENRPHPGAFFLRDAKALQALGHELQVIRIVPYAPPFGRWRAYTERAADEVVDGIRVHTVRAIVPPRMFGMEWIAAQVQQAIRREIAHFQPDVLHAHFLLPTGHAAVRHDLPVVVTSHGGDAYDWPLRRRGLYRAAHETIARATEVTAVSGFIRDCLQRIAFRDVHVIYNGADAQVFYPRDLQACRNHLGLPAHRAIAAFAGNILRAKGLFDLISAFALIPPEHRMLLALAGSGPDELALRAAAQKAGVEVRFFGVLRPEDVARLFAAADVATLPSHNEGLPNVVCEAMACGRPVIASRVGGIPEIVQDNGTGLLVPAGDVHALANAFARLAQDRVLRSRMGESAREAAERQLTTSVSARRYESVYVRALERFSSPSRKKDPVQADRGHV